MCTKETAAGNQAELNSVANAEAYGERMLNYSYPPSRQTDTGATTWIRPAAVEPLLSSALCHCWRLFALLCSPMRMRMPIRDR